ncbi:hypothetical protein SDC9_206156 [bioreactor metagenome]|uniref:Uncharacterized protein n=1 Tax=bioreactor metagenome TaxID=1076179 RepID=A0A645J492_9ZZZZ
MNDLIVVRHKASAYFPAEPFNTVLGMQKSKLLIDFCYLFSISKHKIARQKTEYLLLYESDFLSGHIKYMKLFTERKKLSLDEIFILSVFFLDSKLICPRKHLLLYV